MLEIPVQALRRVTNWRNANQANQRETLERGANKLSLENIQMRTGTSILGAMQTATTNGKTGGGNTFDWAAKHYAKSAKRGNKETKK